MLAGLAATHWLAEPDVSTWNKFPLTIFSTILTLPLTITPAAVGQPAAVAGLGPCFPDGPILLRALVGRSNRLATLGVVGRMMLASRAKA